MRRSTPAAVRAGPYRREEAWPLAAQSGVVTRYVAVTRSGHAVALVSGLGSLGAAPATFRELFWTSATGPTGAFGTPIAVRGFTPRDLLAYGDDRYVVPGVRSRDDLPMVAAGSIDGGLGAARRVSSSTREVQSMAVDVNRSGRTAIALVTRLQLERRRDVRSAGDGCGRRVA